MTLLSESKSRPHTCSAIIGRVSTRPALRTRYSRSAYSRVVSSTRRPPRVTAFGASGAVPAGFVGGAGCARSESPGAAGSALGRVAFLPEPLVDEARGLPLVLDD